MEGGRVSSFELFRKGYRLCVSKFQFVNLICEEWNRFELCIQGEECEKVFKNIIISFPSLHNSLSLLGWIQVIQKLPLLR